MACISLGKIYINGNQNDIMLVCGMITKDAEIKSAPKGTRYATTSIIARSNSNGTNDFFTLTAWGQQVDALSMLRKGDFALCIGKFNRRETGGKTFLSLNCDYISKSGAGCFANGTSMTAEDVEKKFIAMSESDDEQGELPF